MPWRRSGRERFFNDKTIGVVYSANLTPGGPTAAWSTEDFVRAIRYGVRPDGSGLFIMPSLEYNHMSDYDLGCLIAYLRSLPASDNPSPPAEFTFMAQVMAGAGLFGDLYSASVLDLQDGSARERPEVGETLAYGEYVMLISGCQSCHGEAFNGAKSPDPCVSQVGISHLQEISATGTMTSLQKPCGQEKPRKGKRWIPSSCHGMASGCWVIQKRRHSSCICRTCHLRKTRKIWRGGKKNS